ncbi:hypothetical protein D6C95_03981 [Aureobasidium pullulans]|nr:hypothetical protein D6C95_03981 [Aureobasidium pullulans]
MAQPSHPSPSETSRAREVFKCLEAFETSIHPLQFSDNDGLKDRVPVGSDDTALAAFAQLGALRLKAQRCMITLISKDEEYILAESTRTLSLQSDLVHNSRDALWLGTTRFPREEGFTLAGLTQWSTTKEHRDVPEEDGYYYTDGISPHWYIVSDIRQNPELQKLMLVTAGPDLRFYASVPIRTSTGLVVGCYCILDDRPRFGISAEEMVFMEDIADTIMGHLEAKRTALQRQRGDRLIKGLALFSEGKDSLREWWLDTHSRKARGEGARRRRASIEEDKVQNERADEELGMTYRADDIPHGRQTPVFDGKPLEPSKQLVQAPKPSVKTGHLAPDKHEGFDLGREVNAAFARSSNLMREALSCEGVAFIDADFHRSKESTKNQESSSTEPESDTTTASSGPESASPKHQPPVPPDAQCALLGFSTKVKSTVRGFDASAKHSSLPKAFIRSLVRRYPMGKVFNYHDGKALSSSSGTELSSDDISEGTKNNRSRKRRSREYVDAMTLADVFSTPRSIAFLPLWDSRRERWRSAVFVWNNFPGRFLDKAEDVTYLAAFSNSLMAELSRLDAIAADQAKATFISSVSHELRSPLHGVLAGVELLQESDLNNYQQEMTTTISMAGKTLLDTINNILDFTKINSFTDLERKDRKDKDATRNAGFKTADMGEVGVTSVVDLAVLTENVVDTTVTAKSFQSSKAQQDDEDELAPKTPKAVAVVLNIAKRSNWNLSISPGSWTRVITNLLGNSLKYTKVGTITVSLQYKKSEDANKALVSLTIEDSGQGIGSEYLRNHLYTPFMQENTHAVGTGLGLSIVKQIVKDFGGRINFESELGRGTKVVVTFHADFEEDVESEINVPKCPDGSALKLAFSKSIGKTDGDLVRDRTIKTSTSKTCKEWLDCKSDSVSVSDGADKFDVCILTETDYDQWQEKRRSTGNQPPMVVLGSISASSVVRQSAMKNAIFLNQPFGPRKMSRALAAALSSTKQIHVSSNNPVGVSASPSALEILTKPAVMSNNSDPPPTYAESKPSATVTSIPATPTTPEKNDAPRTADINEDPDIRKVLLVEDNSINMKLLVATMRKLKRPYTCAANGLEAVTSYASSPSEYALVLMDISMPVMDGFTATEMIRALEERNSWDRCTIMALTGVGDAEAKKRAFLAGVDDFMTKPVSMQKLTGRNKRKREASSETEKEKNAENNNEEGDYKEAEGEDAEEGIATKDFALSSNVEAENQARGIKRRRDDASDGYDDKEDQRLRSIVEQQATAGH